MWVTFKNRMQEAIKYEIIDINGDVRGGKVNGIQDVGGIWADHRVDNLPIPLLKSFIDLSEQPSAKEQKLVVGIDIRSGESLHLLQSVLSELRQDVARNTAFSFWMLRMRYWSSVIRRPDGITHCPGRSVFRQASSRSGQRSDF